MSANPTAVADLRELARAQGHAAIECFRKGQHDQARAHMAKEGELIAELRRLAPELDLSKEQG